MATSTCIPGQWLRLRVGKFKAPIGLERLQSDADLPFVERALDQNLSSQRDAASQLWGDVLGGIFHYAVGIVNGVPDTTATDTDINHAKDFVGRIFFQPFRTEALQRLRQPGDRLRGQTGNRKGRLPTAMAGLRPRRGADGPLPFRTAGKNRFFQYSRRRPTRPGR